MSNASRIERDLTRNFEIGIWDLRELDKAGPTRIGTHHWRCDDGSLLEAQLLVVRTQVDMS